MESALEFSAKPNIVLNKRKVFEVLNNSVIDTSKPYIRISLRLPFHIRKGVVVDCETTGLPVESYGVNGLVLSRGNVKMVSFGFLEGNLLYCYGLWNPFQWRWFEQICRNLLKNKKPLYAYTCSFEECFLGFKGNWIECLEWGDGYSEWYDEYYSYRKSLSQASWDYGLRGYFHDVDGSQVPNLWKRYVNQANLKCLQEIIYHNTVDVLRLGYIVWRKKSEGNEIGDCLSSDVSNVADALRKRTLN